MNDVGFFELLFDKIEKNPVVAFLVISLFINAYLFRETKILNNMYIQLLKDNIEIGKQMGVILQRLKIKGGKQDGDGSEDTLIKK